MKRKISLYMGLLLLIVILSNNVRLAYSLYNIDKIKLPDFFYQQASFDKIGKFKANNQKCKVRILAQTIIDIKTGGQYVYHCKTIVVDERW